MSEPTGGDLASGTTDGDTLSQAPTWEEREITFGSPYALTSGTEYAIIVRATSALYNTVYWNVDYENNYANGVRFTSSDSGSSWSEDTGNDCWFKTKAAAVIKEDGSFAEADLAGPDESFYDTTWIAQTFVASSSYSISSVILEMCRWPVTTPGTITVSIRATLTAPTKADTPAPSDAAADVTLDQATLTWADGGGADTFDVYYGTVSGSLSKVSSAQAGTSFTVTGITDGSPYNYLITRYWRIDSTNNAGTTTGDEWSFTTIRLDSPTVTYFYPATGQYYRLLVQADGSYGDPPPSGVENTDYVFLASGYEANCMRTVRKLVSAANDKIWLEDI
jgi:hypothetical protein